MNVKIDENIDTVYTMDLIVPYWYILTLICSIRLQREWVILRPRTDTMMGGDCGRLWVTVTVMVGKVKVNLCDIAPRFVSIPELRINIENASSSNLTFPCR